MRKRVKIDEALLDAAMTAGEFKTASDAAEAGLREFLRRHAGQNLRALRGRLQWDVEADWPRAAPPHGAEFS